MKLELPKGLMKTGAMPEESYLSVSFDHRDRQQGTMASIIIPALLEPLTALSDPDAFRLLGVFPDDRRFVMCYGFSRIHRQDRGRYDKALGRRLALRNGLQRAGLSRAVRSVVWCTYLAQHRDFRTAREHAATYSVLDQEVSDLRTLFRDLWEAHQSNGELCPMCSQMPHRKGCSWPERLRALGFSA